MIIMKRLNRILFSLNLVLIASVIALLLRPTKTQVAPPPLPSGPQNENSPAANRAKLRPYGSLVSESDWGQWVETLREAGVPTRVLARLVREAFDDRWQKRQDQAYAACMRGELDANGLAVVSMEHDIEQEKAIRAVLSESEFRKWDMQNVLQSLNLREIQLTETETNALYDLEKNLRQRLDQLLLSKLKGDIDQATLDEQRAEAQSGHDARLKELLGDQRCTAMMGADDASAELQHGLREINSSIDVPFETLLEAQTRWNERRHETTAQLQEARVQVVNFEQELERMDTLQEQELQRLLGTNTFDALERAQDQHYAEMKRYAPAWGVDENTIDYVYRMNRYYEKVVNDYQRRARDGEARGEAIDWSGVEKSVREFAGQIGRTVQTYLGDDIFDRLKRNQILSFATEK